MHNQETCYCGHPESSHNNGGYGTSCWHCDCKKYAEQSEKEQASWEKPLKGEESWAVLVGDNRSVRIFGSKEDVKWAMDKLQSDEMEKEAKPQEEPKESQVEVLDGLFADVRKADEAAEKESESTEERNDDDFVYVKEKSHIILSRPKGMSIGEALSEFIAWSGYTDYGRDDIGRAKDQDFLKLWQEWLTSKETK